MLYTESWYAFTLIEEVTFFKTFLFLFLFKLEFSNLESTHSLLHESKLNFKVDRAMYDNALCLPLLKKNSFVMETSFFYKKNKV